LSSTGCRIVVLGLSLGISNGCMTINRDVIRSNVIGSRANEPASMDTVQSDIDLMVCLTFFTFPVWLGDLDRALCHLKRRDKSACIALRLAMM
jgi:hypothetical protein